jgi:hypothetical protein
MATYQCSECGVSVERRRTCLSCYGKLRIAGKIKPRAAQGQHSLTAIDHDAKTAVCSVCGPTRIYTRVRSSGYRDATCATQGSVERARSRKGTTLWLKYGLTIKQYEAMLEEQGNRCAICHRASDKPLCVDHNHATGKVRGLLCWHCNIALGKLQDDPEVVRAALDYLVTHG